MNKEEISMIIEILSDVGILSLLVLPHLLKWLFFRKR